MKLYLWLTSVKDGRVLMEHCEHSQRKAAEERRRQAPIYAVGPLKVVTLTAPRTTKRKAKK